MITLKPGVVIRNFYAFLKSGQDKTILVEIKEDAIKLLKEGLENEYLTKLESLLQQKSVKFPFKLFELPTFRSSICQIFKVHKKLTAPGTGTLPECLMIISYY